VKPKPVTPQSPTAHPPLCTELSKTAIIGLMARPRKFDEYQVVRASRDLFWSQGYAGTSLDDLGEATGLGRGSLYNTFGDKHTIFLRSLDDYCTEASDGVRAQLRDPEVAAYDRLVAHVEAITASTAAERRGCLMAKSAAELSATDPDVTKQVKRTLDAWLRELTATISEAQRDGDIDPEVDPRALASLLLAVLRGIEALRKGGASVATINAAAQQAISLLPVAAGSAR
jgi:TetR/AcrR family transcriptional regulator, transcriptional repressor for nem operon